MNHHSVGYAALGFALSFGALGGVCMLACARAQNAETNTATSAAGSENGAVTASPGGNASTPSSAAAVGRVGDGPGGARSAAPCGPGMALEFSDSGNDLVQANVAHLPQEQQSRTIEFWAWFDGMSGDGVNTFGSWEPEKGFFEYGDPSRGECHIFGLNSFGWPTGADRAAYPQLHPYGNCGIVDQFFVLPAGTPRTGWLHIALGYDKATRLFQFTINGVRQTRVPTGTQPNEQRAHAADQWMADGSWSSNSTSISIGSTLHFHAPPGWQGKMDEFRIWSVLRTPAEIQANMKTILSGHEPNLVAYYKFDEGTGRTFHDATQDQTNDAKVTGTDPVYPKFVPSDIPGPWTCVR